jgi:hypothetical protein
MRIDLGARRMEAIHDEPCVGERPALLGETTEPVREDAHVPS